MGQWHQLECPSCGYAAEVSGGGDAGMQCSTQTVLCDTCKKLYDVVSARAPLFETLRSAAPKEKLISFEFGSAPDLARYAAQ